MPTPTTRLPSPRTLAPGFPNDPLDPAAVRAALARAGVEGGADEVLARLTLLQDLMADLDRERAARPMSDIAARIGVSADTVQRAMSGRTWPALDVVAAIASALDRPLALTRDGYSLESYDRRGALLAQQREAAARAVADASFEALMRRLASDPVLRRRVVDSIEFSP